ncbi:MAG: phage holin family protein [Actinomycetota bacterium]|nr:phage holin family protein [Actinomycetota bacterium]
MSDLVEIRRRLQHLAELVNNMREQFSRLSGPEGQLMKEKAKEEGKRIGIGAGISFFGLLIAAVASVYVLAVIILLVNIALDRLWLSALIVVGGFLLIGGGILAIGAAIVGKSGKELSEMSKDIQQQLKSTGEEMKKTVEEMQEIARKEAEERQKQVLEMAQHAKKIAPVVVGAYVGYRVIKWAVRRRSDKRAMILLQMEEEA